MTQQATMRCVEITTPGAPSVLVEGIRPRPVPAARQVLIKVGAAGVNRPDVLQRQGLYPPPAGASDLPGLEVAGKVVDLADDVTEFSRGDSVCALSPGGGYADYCVVPAAQCLPVPRGLSLVEAASLPETFFTIWFNLFMLGGLSRGQTLLVHGGSSGIGTAAIQIAKAFDVRVYVTAGSDDKCTRCLSLGADIAVNYRTRDFQSVILEDTGGRGVDVVLDMVGGGYVNKNIACLARGGRLVNIYFLNGSRVEIDMMPVLIKGLTLTGSVLRPQPLTVKRQIRDGLRDTVWPLLEAGKIRPVIDRTFPLHKAAEAHALMESSRHTGKIVLVPGANVATLEA